jgi:hypothetical protein
MRLLAALQDGVAPEQIAQFQADSRKHGGVPRPTEMLQASRGLEDFSPV